MTPQPQPQLQQPFDNLSPREYQVAALVALALTDQAIFWLYEAGTCSQQYETSLYVLGLAVQKMFMVDLEYKAEAITTKQRIDRNLMRHQLAQARLRGEDETLRKAS